MSRVPWVALAGLLVGLAAWVGRFLKPVLALLPGCAFKRLTGIPCAACGLTRCVVALGQGEWRSAFHWHPVAAGLAALLPALVLWDLHRAWRGAPYPALPDSRAARLSVWLVLIAIWALQVARGI